MTCTPGDTTKWKQQAGYTNAFDYDNPDVQVVACDAQGNKYALDVSKIPGTQISTATAQLGTTNNEWDVLLGLKSEGATAFANLTSELASKYYSAGGGQRPPATSGWPPSRSTWTERGHGAGDHQPSRAAGPDHRQLHPGQATQLQNVLKYGSLPLNFKILTEIGVGHAGPGLAGSAG